MERVEREQQSDVRKKDGNLGFISRFYEMAPGVHSAAEWVNRAVNTLVQKKMCKWMYKRIVSLAHKFIDSDSDMVQMVKPLSMRFWSKERDELIQFGKREGEGG